jgi:hypothetical protein
MPEQVIHGLPRKASVVDPEKRITNRCVYEFGSGFQILGLQEDELKCCVW